MSGWQRIVGIVVVASVGAGCGRPAPSAAPSLDVAAVSVAGHGTFECNGDGICGVRIAIHPGPEVTPDSAAFTTLATRAVTLKQMRVLPGAVPVTGLQAGRHAIEVQVAFPSDVGTGPPPAWTTACSVVLDLPSDGHDWLIDVEFGEPFDCTITRTTA